jgi:hypothetical protein
MIAYSTLEKQIGISCGDGWMYDFGRGYSRPFHLPNMKIRERARMVATTKVPKAPISSLPNLTNR